MSVRKTKKNKILWWAWPSGRGDINRAQNEDKEPIIGKFRGRAFSVEGTEGAKALRLEQA